MKCKYSRLAWFASILCMALLSNCARDLPEVDSSAESSSFRIDRDNDKFAPIESEAVGPALHGIDASILNLDNPKRVVVERPDGVVEEMFLIGEDIEVTSEQLQELRESKGCQPSGTDQLVQA